MSEHGVRAALERPPEREEQSEVVLSAAIASSRYGAVEVLRDLHVEVGAGEIVAVLGANGAGKTTLLRTISGILVKAAAEIHLGGEDLSRLSAPRRVRAGLVHVPEGRRIFPDLTVAENLEVAGRASRRPRAGMAAGLERVFALFPRLGERRRQRGSSLSGGEQQMLAIGRGLMAEPRLLMVDEASLGLSPTATEEMFTALAGLGAGGLGILLVEQNARASLQIADRAYILERGTVSISGPAAELLGDERVAATYLGGHLSAAEGPDPSSKTDLTSQQSTAEKGRER